jgi:hypothetical protein
MCFNEEKNEKKIVKKLFVLFLKEEKKIVRKFMFFKEEKNGRRFMLSIVKC